MASRLVALAVVALVLVLVLLLGLVLFPSTLRWPPGCTPIELYDVSGEVTVIPDGEVCELDTWPWYAAARAVPRTSPRGGS
jgi:hypothetical protein